jgi:hypothetical protein
MQIKTLICIASTLVATLSASKAATLTTWNFDNVTIGASASPAPSTGFGTATVLGFGGSSSPTVVSQMGSSMGGANAWSVGNTGGSSVGWSTSAAIGSQGVQFAASTFGYYQIQVSFDIYTRTNSEAALMVQYSQDGIFWQNASITSAGTSGVLATNTITNGIVVGSYLILTNNGAAASWNNGVTVNLTGVPGVANDPNFAIRIVNAATGTNCLDTTGAIYYSANNGDWTLDNVAFQGVSFDTVANWPFDNMGKTSPANNPIPAISNNTATAACFGFGTPAVPLISNTFTPTNSTNDADITANGSPYSSTGPAGQYVWRLRGQPGNGWLSTQPIGSQGAEFDVSTVNYTNIILTFDLYFTTQGEARMCVEYTTDGWVTTNVANLACSSYPALIQTNTPSDASESQGYSSDIVNGTFIDNTIGSLFYNYLSVDFTGVPAVANNPLFGFRIVNAAQNGQCVNFLHQSYNNNSGNARLDNVAVNGQFNGQVAPTLTNALAATVDGSFTNTFGPNALWAAAIKSVYANGVLVTNNAGYTVTSSNIIFTPSKAPVLQLAGLDNIVIFATNYTSAKLVQFVATGVAKKLTYTQPSGPSASGGTLIANPVFTVTDQYGNGTTNPYASMVVTATVSNSPATWILGGSTVQPVYNGSCTFTDLTATLIGNTAIANAAITFTVTGYTNTANQTATTNINSTSFVIGAPPSQFTQGNLAAIQVDTTAANSTLSVIEIKPSAAGQTNPVNINPITATGTNALRMTTSSGAGHLALSDDGTFLVFGAFNDGSSATPDETFNLNRAVGTMNYTNKFTKTGKFVSNSLGGSAVRAACSPDNLDLLIDDKGGLYVYNSANGVSANVYEENNYCIRSFGGSAWSLTQKVVANVPSPAVFQFNNGTVGQLDYYNSGNDGPYNTTSATPPPDGLVVDFYMISTNGSQNPATFAVLYTLDQSGGTNGSSGIINKWSRNPDDSWTANGSWTNTDNGNTLFSTTNGNGGVYLYYANGTGSANSIIRVTDSSLVGSLNIISTNTIYTAPAGTTVVGVTFVPVPTVYATALIPPPILTAQSYVATNGFSSFAITNTPDDPFWRSNITAITVNGSLLPTAAYSTNSAGMIVFNPSQSALLQTSGVKNIVISATGYSTNSVTQVIVGGAVQLAISTQPTAPAADGGVLAKQPVVVVQDQNGFTVTTATSNIVAQVGAGAWTLGGTTTKAAVLGTATFSGLTAFSTNAVAGATISFTSPGLTGVTSASFNIAAPIRSKLGGAALTGGNFKFSFTNATALSFSVRATNNLTAPIATWPVIGPAVESPVGSGNYQFTNSLPATNAEMFYLLSQP